MCRRPPEPDGHVAVGGRARHRPRRSGAVGTPGHGVDTVGVPLQDRAGRAVGPTRAARSCPRTPSPAACRQDSRLTALTRSLDAPGPVRRAVTGPEPHGLQCCRRGASACRRGSRPGRWSLCRPLAGPAPGVPSRAPEPDGPVRRSRRPVASVGGPCDGARPARRCPTRTPDQVEALRSRRSAPAAPARHRRSGGGRDSRRGSDVLARPAASRSASAQGRSAARAGGSGRAAPSSSGGGRPGVIDRRRRRPGRGRRAEPGHATGDQLALAPPRVIRSLAELQRLGRVGEDQLVGPGRQPEAGPRTGSRIPTSRPSRLTATTTGRARGFEDERRPRRELLAEPRQHVEARQHSAEQQQAGQPRLPTTSGAARPGPGTRRADGRSTSESAASSPVSIAIAGALDSADAWTAPAPGSPRPPRGPTGAVRRGPWRAAAGSGHSGRRASRD